MATTKQKLINCTLSSLIGKNVAGIKAQVRNPRYINVSEGYPPLYRSLKKLITYKENNKMWYQLEWERSSDDNCNFTGCTVESDSCMIQISPEELSKLNQQSLKSVK
jgi:hypothetical protein